jgi:hypothetical protein
MNVMAASSSSGSTGALIRELTRLLHELEPIAQIPPGDRRSVTGAICGRCPIENQFFHLATPMLGGCLMVGR